MSLVVVTGSAGLIGAEAVRFLAAQGFDKDAFASLFIGNLS